MFTIDIYDIPNNIFPVIGNEIDVLHNNNSSNFTFVVDLIDFDLQEVETINVESINEEGAWC